MCATFSNAWDIESASIGRERGAPLISLNSTALSRCQEKPCEAWLRDGEVGVIENFYAGPRARKKHLSYDERVDEPAEAIDVEPAEAIDVEPVEIEAEVPAEENEPVEGDAENAEPLPAVFED
jgi:hypothetical protein